MKRISERGFTLIELLVVIAIIAILAAILFPVFAKARDRAKATTCINNEKQIGIALTSYAQDYDEKYPPTRFTAPYKQGDKTWKDALKPLVQSVDVYQCPSNEFAWTTGSGFPMRGDETGRFPRSYATNGAVFPNDTRSVALSKFKNPSGTILICESRYPESNQYSSGATTDWSISPFNGQLGGRFQPGVNKPNEGAFQTHSNGMTNFIFADTHVQALRVVKTYVPQNMWELDPTDPNVQSYYNTWSQKLCKEYQ